MPEYVLKLYVTDRTPRSERAVANLRRLCEHELAGRCELSIIDVLESPHLAEEERILVTPTLIKAMPPPLRRIIGDLSNLADVMLMLELPAHAATERP